MMVFLLKTPHIPRQLGGLQRDSYNLGLSVSSSVLTIGASC